MPAVILVTSQQSKGCVLKSCVQSILACVLIVGVATCFINHDTIVLKRPSYYAVFITRNPSYLPTIFFLISEKIASYFNEFN